MGCAKAQVIEFVAIYFVVHVNLSFRHQRVAVVKRAQ